MAGLRGDAATLAAAVAPTLTAPLPTEAAVRDLVSAEVWRDLVATPLGTTLRNRFADDLVRGLVATGGLVGCFASLDDPSLVPNRAFLHHLVGNGTGERRVPVGGMGRVTASCDAARRGRGRDPDRRRGERDPRRRRRRGGHLARRRPRRTPSACRFVLAGVAPWVLSVLLGGPDDADDQARGLAAQITMLLERLPRLKSGVDPASGVRAAPSTSAQSFPS